MSNARLTPHATHFFTDEFSTSAMASIFIDAIEGNPSFERWLSTILGLFPTFTVLLHKQIEANA
jgi:hypothetical protein